VTAVGNAFYIGLTNICGGVRCNIGTAATGGLTIAWEYWDGDSWEDLGDTDGTNSFKTAGTNDVTWTPPSDWATTTVNGVGPYYYVRARVSVYTPPETNPLGTQFWAIEHRVWDDDMAWAADTYNGKYMVLAGGMAGSITVGTGPYSGACSATEGAGDFQALNYDDTWVDNGNSYSVWDNDENWTSDFYFRVYVGHNTPSDLYVHDSISSAKIVLSYTFMDTIPDATCELQVYDATAAAWRSIADLPTYNNARGSVITKQTFTVPEQYVDDVVDSSGIAKVRFNVTYGTGTAYLYVYYIRFEVDVETTGYSSAITIYDTGSNYLILGTDMTAAATKIWEGIPYSIADPIYKHIDTGESGTFITDGDTIYAMTAASNVEHTTGISTRHYIERTRLEILRDLATLGCSWFGRPDMEEHLQQRRAYCPH